MSTYNKTNVFDFSNPNIDLLALINRQADVEKIVFMGHAANLHKGQQVTLIVSSLILISLKKNSNTARLVQETFVCRKDTLNNKKE